MGESGEGAAEGHGEGEEEEGEVVEGGEGLEECGGEGWEREEGEEEGEGEVGEDGEGEEEGGGERGVRRVPLEVEDGWVVHHPVLEAGDDGVRRHTHGYGDGRCDGSLPLPPLVSSFRNVWSRVDNWFRATCGPSKPTSHYYSCQAAGSLC